jgi:hypothetical protein
MFEITFFVADGTLHHFITQIRERKKSLFLSLGFLSVGGFMVEFF